MFDDYWLEHADRRENESYRIPSMRRDTSSMEEGTEYVHMTLFDGEPVKFKRVWGSYRFTDDEVDRLMVGMEIRINTEYARGIVGSLEWQTYKGYDYYGFSPWDASVYPRASAPFPVSWNGHTFDADEETLLRAGRRVIVVAASRSTGRPYAVNVTFDLTTEKGVEKWRIVPHFEEFDLPASHFTRETCAFMPEFSGRRFTAREIEHFRAGRGIEMSAISKAGKPYTCRVVLALDTYNGVTRWRLAPRFDRW